MRLFEIAVSSYIYHIASGNDRDYQELVDAVGQIPDLTCDRHREALLRWLNKWQCRQFARKYHSSASAQIGEWYEDYGEKLPRPQRNIWELTEDDLRDLSAAYTNLRGKIACLRGHNRSNVRVGPTGAAKILFAVRPKALAPWDDPVRHALNYDGSAQSYVDYIRRTQRELDELRNDCERHEVVLSKLPQKLGWPNTTLPKLIDEYYQVTKRRSGRLPDEATIRQWAAWSTD